MALHFELVTPTGLVRSEDVYMVTVPGTEGDFGVLEGHAPTPWRYRVFAEWVTLKLRCRRHHHPGGPGEASGADRETRQAPQAHRRAGHLAALRP